MYDYIIVGAGAAGCVLANRLSVNPKNRILLLEAGGTDKDKEIRIPAAFSKLFRGQRDWNYTTVADPSRGVAAQYWPRGKVLGGSTSMNAMMYVRGHRLDFDGWRDLGNPGWGYTDILPYFKKSEHWTLGKSAYHGTGGPLHVTALPTVNPLTRAFTEAGAEIGLSSNPDYNGATQEGVSVTQVNQKNGRRWSVADAFLKPALPRPNLTVLTGAHTRRILFRGDHATGVEYQDENGIASVLAEREVILCAGAVNSPQLLLLSGVGPSAHLTDMGIPLVIDLPGVGQNLQDHPAVPFTYTCSKPITLASAETLGNVFNYLLRGKGMLTSNVAEALAFTYTTANLPAPNVELLFAPVFFMQHGFANPPGHGFTIGAMLLRPDSRGTLTLASTNPTAAPLIQPNYFSAPHDLTTLVAGIKIAQQLIKSKVFDSFRGEPVWPQQDLRTEAEFNDYVRTKFQTIYHPVGTCKMGTDSLAVVDPQLRVHGLDRLRVVDASVMPKLIGGHTQAATVMIAEKAADMILHRS